MHIYAIETRLSSIVREFYFSSIWLYYIKEQILCLRDLGYIIVITNNTNVEFK